MSIFQKIRMFISSSNELAFREIYKTRKKKILLNEKTYKNLSKIAPRLGRKLLWTEDIQTEDPYKIFKFINLINWACWCTLFFLFIIFVLHWYIFETYNPLVLSWFTKFWPKKITWIYGRWYLNKKEYLSERAFVFVVMEILIPLTIINFLYLWFNSISASKIHYRLWFFKLWFFFLFLILFILFCDLGYIFLCKNIFWSLDLTLQDMTKHVIEVKFIIMDIVGAWFFMAIKFYSFMSYYTVHILLGICNLLVCITYTEWCQYYSSYIDTTSKEFYEEIKRDMEIDEILSDNEDPFDNNK